MKLGIIGLPGSGKMAIFEALTGNMLGPAHKGEDRVGTVKVPDQRIDVLSDMYQPRKTIYAQVEYFLPKAGGGREKGRDQNVWTPVRDCDALIQVVRNFSAYGLDPAAPCDDIVALDQEMILADLMVVEKRLERIAQDRRRGKDVLSEEKTLLEQCRTHLEEETPLRRIPELAAAPPLRGFAFVSAKPVLILINNEDEDEALPELGALVRQETCAVIRAKLEHELAQMTPQEAEAFLADFNISESAADRVIKSSYSLLGLISFFTVGEDEVRAWTIRTATQAVNAAGAIHSDIQKGFIRAEVCAYADLIAAGSHAAARKNGTVRLEGKTYEVKDGDIINFRFNV